MGNPDPRPDWACLLCRPPEDDQEWTRAHDAYTTCDKCHEKLCQRLTDIVDRYDRLDTTPGSSGDHGTRGAPGFGSRSPASDHIIVMRDWRSKSHEVGHDTIRYRWDPDVTHQLAKGVHGPVEAPGAYVKADGWVAGDGKLHTEQERPPRSIPFTLGCLTQMVAEDRDMTPPQTRLVPQLAHWLNQQSDYITRQDWVGDIDDELRSLLKQLMPVTGDPKIWIGDCPNTLDEGEHTRECRAPLYAPTDSSKDDTIRCPNPECNRKWTRAQWVDLGVLLGERRLQTA